MSGARSAGASWPNNLPARIFHFGAIVGTRTRPTVSDSGLNQQIMRTILFSILGAIILLASFSSCSTTVKTDSGHGVTTGVHAN
jgi:hypothetical protein